MLDFKAETQKVAESYQLRSGDRKYVVQLYVHYEEGRFDIFPGVGKGGSFTFVKQFPGSCAPSVGRLIAVAAEVGERLLSTPNA